MKSSFHAYLFRILVAGLLVTGCSQDQTIRSDMRGSIETELGAVEKVTVMSTDGQEIHLNMPVFLEELAEQGNELEESPDPLKQEDVRFTLVLYRKNLAPLVVSVGEKASQYGDRTFRGPGAIRFYDWIHRQTGIGIISQEMNSIFLTAEDLPSTKLLLDSERDAVKQILREAVPEREQGNRQYPLHPYYRMRIHSNERAMEVTVLTPTLISIPFGRETHIFHVEGSLFSQLTSWLPPREKAADSLEKLFKATKLRVEAIGMEQMENREIDLTASTIKQGMAHEIVRSITRATSLAEAPSQPGKPRFVLHFVTGDSTRSVIFYPQYFQVEKSWFSHNQADQYILKLLDSSGK